MPLQVQATTVPSLQVSLQLRHIIILWPAFRQFLIPETVHTAT